MSDSISGSTTTLSYDRSHLQTFTAPETGTYRITVIGAGGGGGEEGAAGGKGAEVSGVFTLTANETLSILVGGEGRSGTEAGGGGGGGSYVVVPGSTPTPLAIAGGGGGAGRFPNSNGGNGRAFASSGGAGGSGGSISGIDRPGGGGGGGGFTGSGGTGDPGNSVGGPISPGTGGSAFVRGGAGGTGGAEVGDGDGGYGGGGGGGGEGTGGGGGGYSGGNGGGNGSGDAPNFAGFGGTSFDSGTNPTFALAPTLGNGSVTITELSMSDLTSIQPSHADFGRLLGDVLNSPAATTLATNLIDLHFPKIAAVLAQSGQSANPSLAAILHDFRLG